MERVGDAIPRKKVGVCERQSAENGRISTENCSMEKRRCFLILSAFTNGIPRNIVAVFEYPRNKVDVHGILSVFANKSPGKWSAFANIHRKLLNGKKSAFVNGIPRENSASVNGIPRENSASVNGIPRENSESVNGIPRNIVGVCERYSTEPLRSAANAESISSEIYFS
jgi:hypothetical protein